MDCGFNKMKTEGLLSYLTSEEVPDVLGRWIMDGGLGLDLGREREGTGGRNSVPGGEAPLPAARRSPARG